jgi:hypothetical protein
MTQTPLKAFPEARSNDFHFYLTGHCQLHGKLGNRIFLTVSTAVPSWWKRGGREHIGRQSLPFVIFGLWNRETV